ncbi:lipoxygenase homology domain-containing 1 [Brachionus plicatilis]|uniref:Lipoxygenase homology domain-containing 1 n=1 Tax=Brachionus plicatilis TaxID=10195 RepID=A0A3M7RBY9_BRAPC|nr:lipoxygenase homology domain-containing 1 [Brachionus plicatilis]
MNSYLVTVFTSKKSFAGTDANVYIELNGSRGTSDRIFLKNSRSNNKTFEVGSIDTFEVDCPELGTIRKVKIGHDNKGLNPGWHLKEILIESKSSKRTWLCECNRWLDRKEDDGKIERELKAVEQFGYDKKTIKYDPDLQVSDRTPRKKSFYQEDDTLYKITVITSEIKEAGTEADVFIKIFGKRSETEKILLEKSLTNRTKFKSDQSDVFKVTDVDVGKVRKILIGHNNRGRNPSWHLKEVIVEKNDEKYVFPCGKWLDKKLEDGLIERELIPLENIIERSDKAHNFIGSIINYNVAVKTSDILGAGTDSDIFIKIYGQYRKSDFVELKKSLTHRNMFEKGNRDVFELKEEFFGEIIKIKVKQEVKGPNPDWHLNELVIESSDLGRRWIFPFNNWVEKNESGIYLIELYPLKNKDTITDSKEKLLRKKNFKNSKTSKRSSTKYNIEVYTGDLPKCGTDSNVFITLYGEDSESSEFHLNKSETHLNKFERNNVDHFIRETNDLGRLIGIRIRHDNSGFFPSWFLDRVVITDNADKYEFICQKWFSIKRDDCKIDRLIREKNYMKLSDIPRRNQHRRRTYKRIKDAKKNNEKAVEVNNESKYYYVKIYTGGNQDLAGTDLKAEIKIFGDNFVSKVFKLNETKSHEIKFERNQIDVFEIESQDDLGVIYAIELKFIDCLSKSNDLDLEKVEIIDNDFSYRFDYNKAISVKNPDKVKFNKKILFEENAQIFGQIWSQQIPKINTLIILNAVKRNILVSPWYSYY